jgi:hypothetical protein
VAIVLLETCLHAQAAFGQTVAKVAACCCAIPS